MFSRKVIAFAIALIFFLIGTLTLPHYGITWDTVNHLIRGQAYLHYFLTGQKDYSDLSPFTPYYQKENTLLFSPNKPRESIPSRSFYQMNGYEFKDLPFIIEVGHPPLSDTLSSLSNVIFFQKLRLVNDIDSYHLYGIFLVALLIFVVFIWVSENYNFGAGLVSVLALTLYPLFLGEAHFNTEKDIPQAVFYSLTLIFFHWGITKKSWRRLILSSIFCGFALATKFNIVFAPFIVLPWLILFSWPKIRIPKILFFYPFLPLVIFFIATPFLWPDPFVRLADTVAYYQTMGRNNFFDPQFLTFFKFNLYPALWIFYTTPLVILFFSFSGIIFALKKGWSEKNKLALLALLWFLVPVLRVSLPGMGIYNGVRQIMEYIPAMAVLAGIGAYGWGQKLRWHGVALLLALAFLPLTLRLITMHPNENVYFNPLIGGLAGAVKQDFPDAGNSFGNAYRQGVTWLNKNAPSAAGLVTVQEMKSNIPYLWLRSDIDYNNLRRSGFLRQGEYAIGLRFDQNLERSYYGRYLERFLNPVYEVKVDGVSILNVWLNDEAHTKPEYLVERQLPTPKTKINQDEIIFDVGQKVFLSRMELVLNENNCSPLEEGYFYLSDDGENWFKMPEVLPTQWPVVVLGDQPQNGKLIYPFAAQPARFIKIKIVPANACVRQINKALIFELPQLKK